MRRTARAGSPYTTSKLFDAQGLVPPLRKELFPARDWKTEWTFAGKDRGNDTSFSGGLERVQTTAEGALKFALGKEGALLGWGNYEGQQPPAARAHLPVGPMTVSVTLRARAPGNVTFLPWCDGRGEDGAVRRRSSRGMCSVLPMGNLRRSKVAKRPARASPSVRSRAVSIPSPRSSRAAAN